MMMKIKNYGYIRTDGQILSDYFDWLCYIARINQEKKSYFLLANELHRIEYYSIFDNDENRGKDGQHLREEYASQTHEARHYYCLDGPCTMLEMLVALATRMDSILWDPKKGDQTYIYFWELLKNIKLDDLDDDYFYEKNGSEKIRSAVRKILERRYRANGSGGLFPLENAKRDMRNVEIWYQMQFYLEEKYPMKG